MNGIASVPKQNTHEIGPPMRLTPEELSAIKNELTSHIRTELNKVFLRSTVRTPACPIQITPRSQCPYSLFSKQNSATKNLNNSANFSTRCFRKFENTKSLRTNRELPQVKSKAKTPSKAAKEARATAHAAEADKKEAQAPASPKDPASTADTPQPKKEIPEKLMMEFERTYFRLRERIDEEELFERFVFSFAEMELLEQRSGFDFANTALNHYNFNRLPDNYSSQNEASSSDFPTLDANYHAPPAFYTSQNIYQQPPEEMTKLFRCPSTQEKSFSSDSDDSQKDDVMITEIDCKESRRDSGPQPRRISLLKHPELYFTFDQNRFPNFERKRSGSPQKNSFDPL